MSREQKETVLRMLEGGYDRYRIAEAAGVTPAQVSAIAAHVTMGTYAASPLDVVKLQAEADAAATRALPVNPPTEAQTLRPSDSRRTPVLIGDDMLHRAYLFTGRSGKPRLFHTCSGRTRRRRSACP
jgi:hypothetical protein